MLGVAEGNRPKDFRRSEDALYPSSFDLVSVADCIPLMRERTLAAAWGRPEDNRSRCSSIKALMSAFWIRRWTVETDTPVSFAVTIWDLPCAILATIAFLTSGLFVLCGFGLPIAFSLSCDERIDNLAPRVPSVPVPPGLIYFIYCAQHGQVAPTIG